MRSADRWMFISEAAIKTHLPHTPAAAGQPSASPLLLLSEGNPRLDRVVARAWPGYMGMSSKISMANLPLPSVRNGCPAVSARAPSRESASTIV